MAEVPGDWVLHANFGRLLMTAGNNSSAAMECAAVTRLLPHSAEGWANLGRLALTWNTPGEKAQARDVAVDNLEDQYTVFVKNELPLRATLQVRGYVNQPIQVELLVERPEHKSDDILYYPLRASGVTAGGEQLFALDLTPELCGKLEYRIRMYPYHAELIHKFELGLMVWS